jgi:hypothetical protein
MNSSREKPFRYTNGNRASKPFDSERWNHSGYDQLQYEQERKFKNEDRDDRKYKKTRRFQNDDTMAADRLEQQVQENSQPSDTKKWTHDKYNESLNDLQGSQAAKENEDKTKTQKPGRKERKPDRQLYSVRDKRVHQDESKAHNQNKPVVSTEPQEAVKTGSKEELNKVVSATEKEAHIYEDDNRSSVSNVSTAISDPLKGYEEEGSMIRDSRSESIKKKDEGRAKEEKQELNEGTILFEMVVETEKKEVVKIYENEEDYEGLLDEVCKRHDMGMRMSLYFKINTLNAIQEVHPEPQKLEPVLDRLLGINYKLILVDDGWESADEITLLYIEDKGRWTVDTLEDSIQETEEGEEEAN